MTVADIEALTRRWERALADHDLDGLVACYAADATLESPVVMHLDDGVGVCEGREELRRVLGLVVERTPELRRYHRENFHTDGSTFAVWEYPRLTPAGEQMDFVEVMNFAASGLIQHHRVYWGWRGLQVILQDEYHRA